MNDPLALMDSSSLLRSGTLGRTSNGLQSTEVTNNLLIDIIFFRIHQQYEKTHFHVYRCKIKVEALSRVKLKLKYLVHREA